MKLCRATGLPNLPCANLTSKHKYDNMVVQWMHSQRRSVGLPATITLCEVETT